MRGYVITLLRLFLLFWVKLLPDSQKLLDGDFMGSLPLPLLFEKSSRIWCRKMGKRKRREEEEKENCQVEELICINYKKKVNSCFFMKLS